MSYTCTIITTEILVAASTIDVALRQRFLSLLPFHRRWDFIGRSTKSYFQFPRLKLQSLYKPPEYAQVTMPPVQIVPLYIHLFLEIPHHWTAICFERLGFFTILQYSSDSVRVKNCSKRVVQWSSLSAP